MGFFDCLALCRGWGDITILTEMLDQKLIDLEVFAAQMLQMLRKNVRAGND